jgi:hypothetical protein
MQKAAWIDGFYDGVRPIADWERTAWAALGDGDAEMLELTGSPALFGEPGYTERERRWARPTAEVNGIGGGYQGEGSKTVIGREAFVKLSFRLVPDQNPGCYFEACGGASAQASASKACGLRSSPATPACPISWIRIPHWAPPHSVR